jgi:hypothetical protein
LCLSLGILSASPGPCRQEAEGRSCTAGRNIERPTPLNDIYTRREDTTKNFWTLPYVPGRKLGKADVYVLTSAYTFSGDEEFAYNMKQLKRATLLEETPGGVAHGKCHAIPFVFRAAHVLLTYSCSCKFPCRGCGRGL